MTVLQKIKPWNSISIGFCQSLNIHPRQTEQWSSIVISTPQMLHKGLKRTYYIYNSMCVRCEFIIGNDKDDLLCFLILCILHRAWCLNNLDKWKWLFLSCVFHILLNRKIRKNCNHTCVNPHIHIFLIC